MPSRATAVHFRSPVMLPTPASLASHVNRTFCGVLIAVCQHLENAGTVGPQECFKLTPTSREVTMRFFVLAALAITTFVATMVIDRTEIGKA